MSQRRLRVLMVAAEAAPLAKEGGLADVVGALSRALRRSEVDVRVILPAYRDALQAVADSDRPLHTSLLMGIPWDGRTRPVRIRRTLLIDSVPVYLVDEADLFTSRGIYRDPDGGGFYPDNGARFLFFSKAAASFVRRSRWFPDVVHLHDNHTGAVPTLYRHVRGVPGTGRRPPPGWVFTIHNIAYQGILPAAALESAGLPPRLRRGGPLLWKGRVNTMKAGIATADLVTTVSPTYANEIRETGHGRGLQTVVRRRRGDLVGILNGIDTQVWDPAGDPHIAALFDTDDRGGKRRCRSALRREMGLPGGGRDRVLVGIVSRLVEQKGWDLIVRVFPGALRLPLDLVVLGTGDQRYERIARNLQERYPDRVRVKIGFDDGLAHRIEAGADAFLMPSKFEPCGLNQMYSLRYGTLPIVRQTGGLADTVIDLDADPARGNGFVLRDYRAPALLDALKRMCTAYEDRRRWTAAVRRAMDADHSWERSAAEYRRLYDRLRR